MMLRWRLAGLADINAGSRTLYIVRNLFQNRFQPARMIVSLPATPWFYRCINAALLLVVAWLLAGLIWLVLSPRPLPPVAAPATVVAQAPTLDTSALNGLFAGPSNNTGDIQPSTLNMKLRGVIANADPAAAVFERPGMPALAVRLGDELEGGIRLKEVFSDHVVLDNRGRLERMELDAKPAASGVLPADAPPPQMDGNLITEAPPMRALPPNGEIRGGDERILSRQALMSGMQSLNVAEWARGLADAPNGNGIAVEDAAAQPLAGPLGLQSGDVIQAVNGAPLNRTGDISALYGAFSRAPNITVDILRNGTHMSLRFRIESLPSS